MEQDGKVAVIAVLVLVVLCCQMDRVSSASDCGSLRFSCADGTQCLPGEWRCDSRADCRDGSDEVGCAVKGRDITCLQSEYKCGNGSRPQCVAKSAWCDGSLDCDNEADELFCVGSSLVCPIPFNFKCATSVLCISLDMVCNGVANCNDGSDETTAACNIKTSARTTSTPTTTSMPTTPSMPGTSRTPSATSSSTNVLNSTSASGNTGGSSETESGAEAVARENSQDTLLIAVGAGVGGVLLLGLVAVVLVLLYRRSHSFKSSRGSNQDSFRSILRRDGGQDQVHANATASDSPAPFETKRPEPNATSV